MTESNNNQGFEFIEPSSPVPTKPIFIVIGGYPGLGKTSLSFTAANNLHIDVDLGLERAVQKKRPLSVRVTKYLPFKDYIFSDKFEKFIAERSIKTVTIDTLGALLDDVIAPYLMAADSKNTRAGGLSLQGWGALGSEFGMLVVRFRSLNLQIMGLAHAKEDGDDGPKQLRLAIKGGSNEIVLRKCDMLGFITLRQNKRTLDFNATDYQIGKNTAGLDAMIIPDATTPEYDNFLEGIIEKTYKKMGEMSEAQIQALALMSSFNDELDTCDNYVSLTELAKKCATYPTSVKVQTIQLVIAKYLGLFSEQNFVEGVCEPDHYNSIIEGSKDIYDDFKKPVFIEIKKHAALNDVVYNSKTLKFEKKA